MSSLLPNDRRVVAIVVSPLNRPRRLSRTIDTAKKDTAPHQPDAERTSMAGIAQVIVEMGSAGRRLAAIGAAEGAAGNISVFFPAVRFEMLETELAGFSETHPWSLPAGVTRPEGLLLVTGSGCRLADIAEHPLATLCVVSVDRAGQTCLHRAPHHVVRPTSEIDAHAGIHAMMAQLHDSPSCVLHAQPPNLTYLSHIPAYQDQRRMNRQLLRWQPETVVALPEGLAVIPYATPGTPQHGLLTTQAMRDRRLAVWCCHGVIARAGGPLSATDLVDYVEAAARYEVFDLQSGRPAPGLSLDHLRAISTRFGIHASVLDELPEDVLAS
jgi:rhamnulose-1-phosphate aldolase